jgi:hypothetical protein
MFTLEYTKCAHEGHTPISRQLSLLSLQIYTYVHDMYMLYTRLLYISAIASLGGTHDSGHYVQLIYICRVLTHVCALFTPVYNRCVYTSCAHSYPLLLLANKHDCTTTHLGVYMSCEHHQLVHPLHIHMVQFVYMQACTPLCPTARPHASMHTMYRVVYAYLPCTVYVQFSSCIALQLQLPTSCYMRFDRNFFTASRCMSPLQVHVTPLLKVKGIYSANRRSKPSTQSNPLLIAKEHMSSVKLPRSTSVQAKAPPRSESSRKRVGQ